VYFAGAMLTLHMNLRGNRKLSKKAGIGYWVQGV